VLTASQFDQISVPITDLYELYMQSVINDIARRLSKLDMSASAAWQLQRLIESGKVYDTALDEIAALTGKSVPVLRAAFEQAGVKAMAFDDAIYIAAGLNPIPLNLLPAMLDVLMAGLNKTGATLHNVVMTTALRGQEAFVDAADLAYMQVVSGTMSYDQAIRAAVKQVADDGLKVIEYRGGRQDQLDVAMRRTVLTGVAQTTGNLQLTRAKEMGTDLVQTSAHIGARPTHQPWQGHIFSLSGVDPKYPDFITETGYGTVTGLSGVNCRHSWYPFFEGISENAYKQATLDEYADAVVEYNGEGMSVYDAIQKQRGVEREIRKIKRESSALSAAGFDNVGETIKIRKLQMQLRDFVSQTGLDRQSSREGGRIIKTEV
jgi:hypothetical protein